MGIVTTKIEDGTGTGYWLSGTVLPPTVNNVTTKTDHETVNEHDPVYTNSLFLLQYLW